MGEESMISTNCRRVYNNQDDDRRRNGSDDDDREESGWTLYLEEDGVDDYSSFTSGLGGYSAAETSSMVSDLASSPSTGTRKLEHGRRPPPRGGYCRSKSSKKRRTSTSCVDDDLEDTATSPAQSSKVAIDFNQLHNYVSSKVVINDINTNIYLQGNGNCNEQAAAGKVSSNEVGGNYYTTTLLRSKGLCLVPVSMFFNHSSCAS